MIVTKHRYKLILHSILILECDSHFNFNLKLIKQCNRNAQFLHLTTTTCSYNLHQDFVDKNSQYSHVI